MPADLSSLIAIHRQATPVSDQLFEAVRDAIRSGRVGPGEQLPSTRDLAKQLGLSRNTVLAAYSELLMHGLIETRVGFGTVVADATIQTSPPRVDSRPRKMAPGRASLHWTLQPKPPRWFTRAQMAAIRDVARLRAEAIREECFDAVQQHLALRGVNCSSSEIAIVDNRVHALDLIARVLGARGVWFEEPGDAAAKRTLIAAGLDAQALPVDQLGANIALTRRSPEEPSLAYVTPSHQIPHGVTMNARRRRMLREWASRRDGWIIEDDATSFLRWPVPPPLYEPNARVIHVATIAPTFEPFVTTACVVADPELIAKIRAIANPHLVGQRVVSRMLATGALQRERRRLRVRARKRDQAIVEHVREQLSWFVSRVTGTETGDRAVLWLHQGYCATTLAALLGADALPRAVVLDLSCVADHELGRHFESVAGKARGGQAGLPVLHSA